MAVKSTSKTELARSSLSLVQVLHHYSMNKPFDPEIAKHSSYHPTGIDVADQASQMGLFVSGTH